MTAHDPRVTLTEVLAAHVRLPMMHSQGCSCGWHASLSHPDLHRAHLAERIEEHIDARWTDPRVTLTEAEKALLYEAGAIIRGDAMREGATFGEADAAAYNAVLRPVERIIAARLAPIRALADEWEQPDVWQKPLAWWWESATRLRAALDAPVSASQDHDGAEGQGEGEKAGEGDLCAAECGKRVDRTIPNPIPGGFELMWSESMTGRALYCQTCFDKPDPEES